MCRVMIGCCTLSIGVTSSIHGVTVCMSVCNLCEGAVPHTCCMRSVHTATSTNVFHSQRARDHTFCFDCMASGFCMFSMHMTSVLFGACTMWVLHKSILHCLYACALVRMHSLKYRLNICIHLCKIAHILNKCKFMFSCRKDPSKAHTHAPRLLITS